MVKSGYQLKRFFESKEKRRKKRSCLSFSGVKRIFLPFQEKRGGDVKGRLKFDLFSVKGVVFSFKAVYPLN